MPTFTHHATPRGIPAPNRGYKYFDFVMAAFVTVVLCSNLIGPDKRSTLFGHTFGSAILFFPVSYIFGDILTEVYGYARSRRVVWAGFAAMIFASFMSFAVISLPPAEGYINQKALEAVFGNTPRVVLASIVAFWMGEFANSYVLAKMKIWTGGKYLWSRTIGSTIVGEGVDSLVFYPLAFLGVFASTGEVVEVMIANYLMKVGFEVIMTPLTYRIVHFLKRIEHEDYYDWNTNFTPFSLQT